MLENEKFTSLSEIGEFGLIEKIKQAVKINHQETILGIGDDAAVLDSNGKKTVISTDLLVEGIHFDMHYTPLKHLGYKAVVVNLSDIVAMNAQPKQITVSIAISSKYTLEAVDALYEGILLACKNYNIDIVGGDTTSAPYGMTISITSIGYADENKIVRRNTAKLNDIVCVTGNLGAAYAGLMILEREKKLFLENNQIQPELDGYDYVLERQLKPEARIDTLQLLAHHNILPTSMIDISDGLSSEAIHIAKESDLGVRIVADKLPIDTETLKVADELNLPHFTVALNGGEDYELLFTVSQKDYDKISKLDDISVIGFITEKESGYVIVDESGNTSPLTSHGWSSF